MKKYTIAIVIAVLLLATIACSGITIDLGGQSTDTVRIEESGNVISENRPVSGFDSISFDGIGQLNITQGDTESLTVKADEKVMPLISTEVRGSTLYIKMNKAINVNLRQPITYDLTVKDLKRIDHNGLGDMQVGKLTSDDFTAVLQGAGNLEVRNLTGKTASVELKGLGRVKIEGQVDSLTVRVPGAGSFDGEDLQCRTADVEVTGLGSATVWVTDTLNARIGGAGSINYYGNPQVSQSVNGLGSVNSKGDK